MSRIFLSSGFFIYLLFLTACQYPIVKDMPPTNTAATDTLIGGPFENRELFYADIPAQINSIDTSPAWNAAAGLLVEGVIFEPDGRTPAPDVILYYYHTNQEGYYANGPNLLKVARPHGYIRGWVKTDSVGRYKIYTSRPGPYPGRTDPAHIHPAILEPGASYPYYIDEFVFDDDPRLTKERRRKLENRGGSGILRTEKAGALETATRNIILGLHIPNYPRPVPIEGSSGPALEEDIFSFTPEHVWGPDAGTEVCPICKYGRFDGALLFLRSASELLHWENYIRALDQRSRSGGIPFHATVVLSCAKDGKEQAVESLKRLGEQNAIQSTNLAILPSFADRESEIVFNHLDTTVNSTLLFYRKSKVIAKLIDSIPAGAFFPLAED